jgi:uncharacterized membrane protein
MLSHPADHSQMRTLASISKHPIHPMLVVFPIGLGISSLICDLVGLSVAMSAVWFTVALYAMGGGLIGALAAVEVRE